MEDDGCHSLLDYEAIAESARVLGEYFWLFVFLKLRRISQPALQKECIARSLNSVVLERKIIQAEVQTDEKGDLVLVNSCSPITVNERPVFAEKMINSNGLDVEESHGNGTKLRKESGFFTRAEITIQRVETHLLDPSPISIAALADSSASGDSPTKVSAGFGSAPNGTLPQAEEEGTSISETLARNLRVAVVGKYRTYHCEQSTRRISGGRSMQPYQ